MCDLCDYIDFWKRTVRKKEIKFEDLAIHYVFKSNISIIGSFVDSYEVNKKYNTKILSRDFPLNYCPMCGRKLGE